MKTHAVRESTELHHRCIQVCIAFFDMIKVLKSVLMAKFAHVMPAASYDLAVLRYFPCTDTAEDLVVIIRASQPALLVITLVTLLRASRPTGRVALLPLVTAGKRKPGTAVCPLTIHVAAWRRATSMRPTQRMWC